MAAYGRGGCVPEYDYLSCLFQVKTEESPRTRRGKLTGVLDIHPVEEQHEEVDIQIERAAGTLYQGICPGLGRHTGKTRFLSQMCGNAALDNAEHPAHDTGLEFQAGALFCVRRGNLTRKA